MIATSPAGPRRPPRRWLGPVVVLVALHSYGVGIGMLIVPGPVLDVVGWEEVKELFFVRQAGVFHLLVATAYLVEYRLFGTVRFLLLVKATAVVFLVGVHLVEPAHWLVPLSAVLDGLMVLAVVRLRGR